MLHLPLALTLLASVDLPAGNVRVIDANTKAPISGAVVYGVQEANAPVWGTFWSRVSATTDEDGWAFLPVSTDAEQYSWAIVQADGYAVHGSMQVPREGWELEPAEIEAVELQRAVPAKIRVVDHLGRPAPLVHLGFCVGCGHTPDVASAVTDRSGEATLFCVGRGERDIADIYPVRDGVKTDYLWVDWDDATAGGYEAIVEPGGTLEGRLFTADGSPARQYAVGVPEIHRGPWARTDATGFFRLHGVATSHVPYLQVKDPSGETIASFEGSKIGVERILRLPAEPWGDTEPARNATLSLTVNVEGDGIDHAAIWPAGVPGVLWDPKTGWSSEFEAPVGAATQIQIPSGSFQIEVGGGDGPYARQSIGRIDVPAGDAPLAVEHTLPPVRIVRLEATGVRLDSKVQILASNGVWSDVEFDSIGLRAGEATGTGVIERFVIPAEPFGLWLSTEEPGRDHDIFEIDGLVEGSDVLRARPRAR